MNKKCLLIIPKHFYSFQKQFSLNLEERGYEVVVVNDGYPEGILGRIIGKLEIPFGRYLT